MNTAVKIGLIIVWAFATTGIDKAAENKSISGINTNEKMKTAITSGQSNISSTDEPEDDYLFPLSNAILNRL